jgi:hypothetical protein
VGQHSAQRSQSQAWDLREHLIGVRVPALDLWAFAEGLDVAQQRRHLGLLEGILIVAFALLLGRDEGLWSGDLCERRRVGPR